MSTFRSVRLSSFEQPKFGQSCDAKSLAGNVAQPSTLATSESSPLSSQQPRQNTPRCSTFSTDSYDISMLLAKPAFLEKLNGKKTDVQIDGSAGYALVNCDGGSFVWPYTSNELTPFALGFGQEIEQATTATLIDPSSPAAEPGIVLINKDTGAITMWESVGRSIADGMFTQGNSLERVLTLQSGEQILRATNIPRVGLVTVTSRGRLYLVNLRNAQGKPQISVSQMHSFRGGLASLKESFFRSSYQNEISAIAAGPQINESERAVCICTKSGKLTVWHCSNGGTSRMVAELQLLDPLYRGICLLYPQANLTLRFHDIHVEENHLFALVSFRHENSYFWLVGFADITGANVIFSSLHRLQSYVSTEQHSAQLVVTDKMVYATLRNAIVLLERESQPQQPRFEDAVYMRPGTSLFGSGISQSRLEIVTSSGVMEVQMKSRLVCPTALSRVKTAVLSTGTSLPLDFQPHTPLGTVEEIRDAARAMVSEINKLNLETVEKTLKTRLIWLKVLQRAIDGAPLLKEGVPAADLDTRWWIAEEIALVAAAETVRASTVAADPAGPVQDLGGTPAVLISLLTSSPELGFKAIYDALSALKDAGVPEEFPQKCPWLASRELVTAAESAALKMDVVSAQSVEAVCGVYALRLAFLKAIGNAQEFESLSKSAKLNQERLLHSLGPVDIAGAIHIAEKFTLVEPLAALVAASWDATDVASRVPKYIQELGYEFAEPLFTQLLKTQGPRMVFQEFLDSQAEYLDRYVEEHHLYRQSWVLAFFNGDLSRAARVLEQAAIPKPGQRIPPSQRLVIASLQKLCAVQAGEQDVVASADRELSLAGAQESLRSQKAQAGEFLTVNRPGINELVSKLLDKAQNEELSVNDTVDLLTFVPPKTPGSELNYARGFELRNSSPARSSLLAQQTILNTDWANISEANLGESLIVQTLRRVPVDNVRDCLLSPASWTAPTSAEEIKALYPWASPATVNVLQTDFTALNSEIEKICRQYDLMHWLQLIGNL